MTSNIQPSIPSNWLEYTLQTAVIDSVLETGIYRVDPSLNRNYELLQPQSQLSQKRLMLLPFNFASLQINAFQWNVCVCITSILIYLFYFYSVKYFRLFCRNLSSCICCAIAYSMLDHSSLQLVSTHVKQDKSLETVMQQNSYYYSTLFFSKAAQYVETYLNSHFKQELIFCDNTF